MKGYVSFAKNIEQKYFDNINEYIDCLFFAKDTKSILLNGERYGGDIKDLIQLNDWSFEVQYTDGTSKIISFNDLPQLREELNQLKIDHNALVSDVNVLRNDHNALKTKHDQLEQKHNQLELDHQNLSNNVSIIENNIVKLDEKVDDITEEITNLHNENNNIYDEIDQLQQEDEKIHQNLTTIEGSITELSNELDSLTVVKLDQADVNSAVSYQLQKNGISLGATINVPKDMVVEKGEVKTVTIDGQPYPEAKIGDIYIELTLSNSAGDKVYIPANKFVDEYKGSKYIFIDDNRNIILNDSLLKSDFEINTIKQNISDINVSLNDHNEKINNLQNDITSIDDILTDHSTSISNIDTSVNKNISDIANLTSISSTHTTQINNINNSVIEHETEIEELKTLINDKDLSEFKVKDVNKTTSKGVGLTLVDSKVGVSVNEIQLMENLSGTGIKIGKTIGSISETTSIADTINTINNSIPKLAGNGSSTSAAKSDHIHDVATTSKNGFMSSTDKSKLDGIESKAQVNKIESISINGATVPISNKNINLNIAAQNIYRADGTTITSTISEDSTTFSVGSIPTSKVSGLDNLLNNKANKSDVDSLNQNAITNIALDGNYFTYTKNGVSTRLVLSYAVLADKLARNLTIKLNNGSIENTDLFTFNGLTSKTVNVYPAADYYTDFHSTNTEITTAEFVEMLQSHKGLNNGNGAFQWRGSWTYSAHHVITDVGDERIKLAGCWIEYIGNTTHYTIRVTTPSTSTSDGATNKMFIYVNNGPDYLPGWWRCLVKSDLTWTNITNKPETATRWPSWNEVTSKPTVFTPSTHTHTISGITNLQSTLNNKLNSDGNNGTTITISNLLTKLTDNSSSLESTDSIVMFRPGYDWYKCQLSNINKYVKGIIQWNDILNKPTTFTPSSHTHTKSQITDFAHEHSSIVIETTGNNTNPFLPEPIPNSTITGFFSKSNMPSDTSYAGITVKPSGIQMNVWQLAAASDINYTDNGLWYRINRGTSWQSWKKLAYDSEVLHKSGGTMTGVLNLKGGQYTGKYALNLNDSDIINVNGIFTSDVANNPSEGLQFMRSDGSTYDSVWAADGIFKFSVHGNANRQGATIAPYEATYTVLHSGNSSVSDTSVKINNVTKNFATTNHTHNFNNIANAPSTSIAANTVERKWILNRNTTHCGYNTIAAIGLKSKPLTACERAEVLLSVGINDAQTNFTDFRFSAEGKLNVVDLFGTDQHFLWQSEADNRYSSKILNLNQTDLNTVNGYGIATQPVNNNAIPARHYPIQEAGVLIYGNSAHNKANQIYGTYKSNKWFVRGGNENNLEPTAWAQIYTTIHPPAWTKITNKPTFATVATSGSYNDLTNKPTIPTIPSLSLTNSGTGNVITGISVNGHTITATKGTISSTDTKNTAGSSNSTNKLYLIGASSQSSTGVTTHSNNTLYAKNGWLYAEQMYANGGFYETSDERYKTFENDIKVDFDKLKNIPTKYFRWNFDNKNDKLNIGTSAQEIEKLYPELVSKNEDDVLTVDYAKLSVICLAAIKELNKKINDLTNIINNIK